MMIMVQKSIYILAHTYFKSEKGMKTTEAHMYRHKALTAHQREREKEKKNTFLLLLLLLPLFHLCFPREFRVL